MPKDKRKLPKSEVKIGTTGERLYLGVVPPLTDEELEAINSKGIQINPDSIQVLSEYPPECSFFGFGTDLLKAQNAAQSIAEILRGIREGQVRYELEPEWLQGHNSTPFYPNTDPQ